MATAFAGFVLVEGTIAAEQSVRSAFAAAAPLDRAIRLTWQGPVTPAVERQARGLMAQLGARAPVEVALLNPVRLSGVVVRPAAISSLRGWTLGGPAVGACRTSRCPMLVAGPSLSAGSLRSLGVNIKLVGSTQLRSPVPLGFAPGGGGASETPLLLTGDVPGLERLAGLSGVYRTHSWVSPGTGRAPEAWQLAAAERRLQTAQAAAQVTGSQLTLAAPFALLDSARAQADAAPQRLALAGGGALAALAVFIVLTASGLRATVGDELRRLRAAGATSAHCMAFVTSEAGLLCGLGVLVGAAGALIICAALAGAEHIPAGGLISHSLLTPLGVGAAGGLWLSATALITITLSVRASWIADVLAFASAAALTLVLIAGAADTGTLAVLLAPLCCMTAGVLVFRGAGAALRGVEPATRRVAIQARLALVDLARSPSGPSIAIAFVAVSTGLGGFALTYRATLQRSAGDQASNQVPLDAIVSPGPGFIRPLQVASIAEWSSLAHGSALPVRRTEASFLSGEGSETVPALGVPAHVLPRLRGWRPGEASAPIATLARRLVPPGPARTPGPSLTPLARYLILRAQATVLSLTVTADLLDPTGDVHRVPLGTASATPRTLRAPLPPGDWELQAIELAEPTGLQATNGHQNAENPTGASVFSTPARLGALKVLDTVGRPVLTVALGEWRAVGALDALRRPGSDAFLRFSTSGPVGILRPAQPADVHPLPVLVDPSTATAAGQGELALSVDGSPVRARVVGVLRRFPTVPTDSGGFVVADEQQLADALDAQAPGQGRTDELWISTSNVAPLRAALTRPPFSELRGVYRADIERSLRDAPITRRVLDTLVVAAAVAAFLAIAGLLVSLLGSARDRVLEQDLVALGMGPRDMRRQQWLKLLIAALFGALCGLVIAVLLGRLAVEAVGAAGGVSNPQPPLVGVTALGELVLWGMGVLALLALAAWSFGRRIES